MYQSQKPLEQERVRSQKPPLVSWSDHSGNRGIHSLRGNKSRRISSKQPKMVGGERLELPTFAV